VTVIWRLEGLDWVVGCWLKGDPAYGEALTQLRLMRTQEKRLFEELLSACRVA